MSEIERLKLAYGNQLIWYNTVSNVLFSVEGDAVPEVSTVVHGIIQGVEMPFPLKNPNACLDSGLECPLQKDVNYEYVQTLPVLKIYPKVSTLCSVHASPH